MQFVFWEHDDPRLVGLGMSATRGAGLEDITRELVDARTGDEISAEPAQGGFSDTLADVHRSLCVGLAGDVLLSIMAIAFLISLVSGVVVYAPLWRRIGFGVVRGGRSLRILALDTHNLAGMIVLLWALVVGATGFVNTLEAPAFAKWNSDTLPALLARYRDKPALARRSSVDAALGTAEAAVPGMIPTSIGFPESPFGSPRHYLIWMRGDGLFTSRLFTPVLVDAETGELASAQGFPWYLRLLELSRPLHFGDYGGLPLKIAWAALDLLLLCVLATGLYLWLRARRDSRRVLRP